MKCDNCGHKNSPYSIICEKCDTPLKIEENKLLQEKYHKKGKHIDIEERELVQNHSDFNRTRKKVFRVTVFFLFLCLAFFLYFLTNYLLDKGSKEVLNASNSVEVKMSRKSQIVIMNLLLKKIIV